MTREPGGDPPVRFEAVVDKLPADFETTRAEARAERYAFLERLANDWASGAMLFDRPGEALLAAYSEGVLATIGGITVDRRRGATDAALLRPQGFPQDRYRS